MINPFTLYSLFFILALISDLFNVSYFFPKISTALILFITLTIFISIILGIFQRNQIKRLSKGVKLFSDRAIIICASITIFTSIIDGVFSGGFPIFGSVNYVTFGIPTIHPMLIIFSTTLSVLLFSYFILTKKRKYLFFFIIFLIPATVSLSRGTIIMIILCCAWCYLYRSKINFKKIFGITILTVAMMYIFGLVGNYRLNKQVYGFNNGGIFNSSLIEEIGGVASSDSKLAPFYWSYIYMASPIASLQKTIDSGVSLAKTDISEYTVTQFFPDAISGKVFPNHKGEIKNFSPVTQINSSLTVGTVFRESYLMMGWLGLFTMWIGFTIIEIIYLYLLEIFAPEFSLFGLSVINTIYALFIFSNMLSYSGLSLLLVMPFILKFLFVLKRRGSKNNA